MAIAIMTMTGRYLPVSPDEVTEELFLRKRGLATKNIDKLKQFVGIFFI